MNQSRLTQEGGLHQDVLNHLNISVSGRDENRFMSSEGQAVSIFLSDAVEYALNNGSAFYIPPEECFNLLFAEMGEDNKLTTLPDITFGYLVGCNFSTPLDKNVFTKSMWDGYKLYQEYILDAFYWSTAYLDIRPPYINYLTPSFVRNNNPYSVSSFLIRYSSGKVMFIEDIDNLPRQENGYQLRYLPSDYPIPEIIRYPEANRPVINQLYYASNHSDKKQKIFHPLIPIRKAAK